MKAKIASRALLVLLAFPALARANPTVTSDSECPSADAVTAALAGLLPPGGPVSAQARIRTLDDHQEVAFSSEGEPAHSRELPQDPDCGARAQAAALIIAAWMDAMPVGALSLPEVAVATAQPADSLPAEDPSTASERRQVWPGLGVLGMIDTVGANLGLTGEVGVEHVVGGLGLAAALSAALARDVSVGQGSARWWRPAMELQVRLPVLPEDWNVEASLGPAVGLIILQGRGYDRNSKDVASCWGAGAGLRSSRTWGRTRLWIEARARLWPETQKIRNEVKDAPLPRTQELPHWEGYLSLGFSLAVR
jgi:hypothetical protein